MVGLIIDPKLNVDKVPRLILIGQQGEKYFYNSQEWEEWDE